VRPLLKWTTTFTPDGHVPAEALVGEEVGA
jgi:hypothetical protein